MNESRIRPPIRVAGSGAVLYEDFGVSLSDAATLDLHRRHGAAVYVAVDSLMVVRLAAGLTIRDRVVVVPPDTWHAAACPGPFLTLLYDPEQAAPAAIGTRRRADSDGRCRVEGSLAARLIAATRTHRASLFQAEVLAGLGRETAGWLAQGGGRLRLDRRVSGLVEALRDPGADRRELVASLGLSPAHLRDLFAREVGLPMRTFQRWHRLLYGMSMLGPRDATTSAHEAGFADLAHFSRTCREMFGDSPTGLFSKLLTS